MKRRLFLLTFLLAGCTIIIDRNGDSNMDSSLGGVTTLSADGTDDEGNEDATSGSTGGEGSCDYECDGVACNFTCMGESIWVCNSDSMWDLVEDCGAMGKLCEQVGASYECVDPGGDGDTQGDGDPGGGGDCMTVSTTEPPLVPMGPYASCFDVIDCMAGYDICFDYQCSRSCFTDADCPSAPGYAPECVQLDFDSACFLTCDETSDCPGGLVCCDGRCNWP